MQDITPPNKSFIDESLRIISHCPVCHYNYNSITARIIEENSTAHLIHIKCRRCQSAVLALILMNSFGISSVGLITDLSGDEVSKFKDLPAVNADDVLAIHDSLRLDFFSKMI